jgi:AcrR family transcriptional regulator
MARTKGSQDADYTVKRAVLIQRLKEHLLESGSQRSSFSEMAAAAEVSIPTLRHYFRNRSGVVTAVLDDFHRAGARYIEQTGNADLPFARSMEEAGETLLAGYRLGRLDRVHKLGLTEGMGEPDLGRAYLNAILEPALQAIEARLSKHQLRGEMKVDASPRHAALALVAPLLLGALHQKVLGGEDVRPMHLEDLARDHIRHFIRAYQSGQSDAPSAPPV